MEKIIIFLGIITIIVGSALIIVQAVVGGVDDKVESDVKYIVVNPPTITNGLIETREKTEYPDMNYKYLDDTELTFFIEDKFYAERTGEFQFYVDEECKNPITVDPVFISSEIIKCDESYAVLAEENRILFFPIGGEIPHLVSFEQTR